MTTVRKATGIAFAIIALVVLSLCILVPKAQAETLTNQTLWHVTYTADSELKSDFTTTDINETIAGLQAGDTARISIKLENKNAQATNWYMTNKIISSLEESAASAAGGAYTYELMLTQPDGQTTSLFSSDTVGGENAAGSREGLHEATSALEDYFLLDTMAAGASSTITLAVTLDGETQGNAYQSTLADLSMDFAVEPVTDVGDPGNRNPNLKSLPQTGDLLRFAPLFAVCGIAGLALLFFGIYGRTLRKHEEEEA